MQPASVATISVEATVLHILPLMGLAYLADDDLREWAVTKSTPGHGLDRLQPGQRLTLQVELHAGYGVVRQYG